MDGGNEDSLLTGLVVRHLAPLWEEATTRAMLACSWAVVVGGGGWWDAGLCLEEQELKELVMWMSLIEKGKTGICKGQCERLRLTTISVQI